MTSYYDVVLHQKEHDFMIITDLGGDKHAIDRNQIITMTNAIPSPVPEGFVMGGKFTTIVVMTPVGPVTYHTRELMFNLLNMIYRIKEKDSPYRLILAEK